MSDALLIKGNRFVDSAGRHVILHGINLVNKDPNMGYFFDGGPELFAAMRDWGFNVIRLGVIWDGLEPEPGVYDEAYLKRLDQRIAWAKAHNVFVFLDMHQDLYSVLYSDGAPEWATLTDGAPHVDLGGVWSDVYFTSPAVQAALDNFWANMLASDGIGLQDHYANMWAMLAARYVDEPTVIGYDIMNEPFPGSMGSQAIGMMFAKGAELIAASGAIDVVLGDNAADAAMSPTEAAESFSAQWLATEGRSAILQLLRNLDLYIPIVDVTQPIYSEFESTQLMVMYERVANAIREAGGEHALFLETTIGSNMGVYSSIEPVILDGERDPAQVYAPHGYDLVVDTADIADASPERVELIFRRHDETAQRLGMPMLIGEWGAYGRNPGTLPAIWQVVHQFEKLLCSDTYWTYEHVPCFQGIQRLYPERVAGTLQSYHYDPQTGAFKCVWEEDGTITASSRIYLPGWCRFDETKLELTPKENGSTIMATSTGSGNHWLEVPPVGEVCTRKLMLCRKK